jgi:hypothetical protein
VCLLLVAAATVAGCSTPLKPGETNWDNLSGTFRAVEEADLQKVHRATLEVMRNMQLRPHERSSDAFSARIVGQVAVGPVSQERDLVVKLKRLSEATTEISLQILFTRDRTRLEVVHAEIRKLLKKAS